MQARFKFIFVFTLLAFSAMTLRGSISFQHISLDQAKEIAKLENKYVFVDAYATWCGPCKVMDKVFRESKVSSYFNQHFVNIKIDMDGQYGDDMLHTYEVVWLPTLLIINPEGEVLSKIDRLMTGDELIEAAESARLGHNMAPTTSLASNPFSQAQQRSDTQDFNPEEKEEVIYVHDEKASSGRPHIMYHEAYLHLQLFDGKAQEVVRKYLSTQNDWSTEKNIKFIFDFMQDVNSEQFDYFIRNRARFNEIIGKERVDRSLSILIGQRLEKGYPRPTLLETQNLLTHLNPVMAEQNAYKYYMGRQLDTGDDAGYLATARKYIEAINPYDHEVLHGIVSKELDLNDHTSVEQQLEVMHQVLALDDITPLYRHTMALVYFKMKNKSEALYYIDKAIAMMDSSGPIFEKSKKLRSQINTEL